MISEVPMPDHDGNLVGDTRTTIRLNFRWRRLIVESLESFFVSSTVKLEHPDSTDLHNLIWALYDDTYT